MSKGLAFMDNNPGFLKKKGFQRPLQWKIYSVDKLWPLDANTVACLSIAPFSSWILKIQTKLFFLLASRRTSKIKVFTGFEKKRIWIKDRSHIKNWNSVPYFQKIELLEVRHFFQKCPFWKKLLFDLKHNC